MERVLGILGSAVLLSVLSVMFLVVDGQGPENPIASPNETDTRQPYDELSDNEKLERLQENDSISDTTLMNRAWAYKNTTYCEPIDNDEMRESCRQQILEATGQTSEGSTEETITQEDRQLFNRAVAYQNESRCEDIEASSLREKCFSKFS